jgi:oligoribonuclease (3'-5' exoribonuclease)
MKKYMADLSSWLRHWHIDIGTVRRCYEMFVGEDPFHMNNGKTHRALDDVRCHLEEAKAFADMWKHAAELELSRK